MKSKVLFGFIIAVFLFTGMPVWAQKAEDIQKHPNCKYCGMDREMFNYSRMLTTYGDGSDFGACSLHCAAVELALNIDKMPKTVMVADYSSKALIDAEQATWVMGGSKSGVMTRTPKWAFEKKADADAFIKENGGNLASFDSVLKASYSDMYEDTKMIREKRRMMKQKTMEHKH